MVDEQSTRKRTRMVRQYPVHTLEEALAVPRAIQDANAGLSFDRTTLARALGTTPASSGYTMRLNSSARYGLTKGGYNDPTIALTPRGGAIVAPRGAEERADALVQAALEPELFRRFYELLDGKRIPDDPYASNLLQRELGVHAELAVECLQIVKANGRHVGLAEDRSGALYVTLQKAQRGGHSPRAVSAAAREEPPSRAAARGKVFLGHGGSATALEFLRQLLDGFDIPYAHLDPESVSGGLSAEDSQQMRSCSSAILVLANRDPAAAPKPSETDAPQSMAFQLGAATVLYGPRIVVLREKRLAASFDAGPVRSVEFDPLRIEEVGLPLLQALSHEGIIRVTAG